MKLNVLERLMLLGILPKENNFATLKIVRTLTSNLGFDEKETTEFDIKQEGDKVIWNQKGSEEREIEIGEKATDIIVESLKKLDEEKKLNEQLFSVYEKFVK